MASIGHVAVGMVLGRYERGVSSSGRLATSMGWFSVLALLPDADVIAFVFRIPYSAPWGHRGASHSLVFAALVALALLGVARLLRLPPETTVHTGHGPTTSIGDEAPHLDEWIARGH